MKKFNNQKDKTFILSKVEEAILLEKIKMAQKQIEDGEFLTEEELDKEIDSWINASE